MKKILNFIVGIAFMIISINPIKSLILKLGNYGYQIKKLDGEITDCQKISDTKYYAKIQYTHPDNSVGYVDNLAALTKCNKGETVILYANINQNNKFYGVTNENETNKKLYWSYRIQLLGDLLSIALFIYAGITFILLATKKTKK
jgi:hypothetical protein